MNEKLNKLDKDRVLDILVRSFDDNRSVNYIVRQDARRAARLRALMDYAFKVCHAYGKVLLSEDRKACALVLLERPAFSWRGMFWDLQLVLGVCGLGRVAKVLARERLIKLRHPAASFYYVWFVGVDPEFAGQGIGSGFLAELIADASAMGRDVYLETSTPENLSWYERFGFEVFDSVEIGYELYFLRMMF